MRKVRQASACQVLLTFALFSSSCGFIGSPLAPLANVPARVLDLAAIQRGDRIIVQFTLPLKTTEGVTIKPPLELDLRIGPTAAPFSPDQWAAQAKHQPAPPKPKGTVRYEIPASSWTGKEVAIGVRTTGANGKPSEWSNFATLQAIPPPPQPLDLRGESTPAGVRLTWRAAADHFRVLRKGPAEPGFTVVAPDLHTPEFLDAGAAVGTEYTYIAQSFLPQGSNKEAQSDLSDEFKITRTAPPPATPAGLLAVPSSDTIELNWDSNSDSVTTGYRIYRAAPGGDFVKIGEVSAIPAYSDRAVEHGKTYRYAVAAIDKDGRESGRSNVVEVALP